MKTTTKDTQMICTGGTYPSSTTRSVVASRPRFVSIPSLERSTRMNVMHEDLARAHIDARLREARVLRRSSQLDRARRLARRAERANEQARLLLARAS